MGIEAAIIGSAIVGAGSSIFGANKAADAQKKAAKGVDKRFGETKELLQPFIDSGELALKDLQTSLGLLGPEAQKAFFENFQTDPGFAEATKFGLDQVTDRAKLSGTGGGNLLAALSDRARNDLFGAFTARQGALADLAKTGQGAATSLAGAGTTAAAQSGQFTANAGQLSGAGLINAGNAATGALDQFATLRGFQQGQASGASLNPWAASIVPTNRISF